MKISVGVTRVKMIDMSGHHDDLLFIVESSEHESSKECFIEIAGTIKAINADAYAVFLATLNDLHE